MATIETLIAQIEDKALREVVAREVGELKKRLDWGLVFERHLPENIRVLSAPIKPGSTDEPRLRGAETTNQVPI
jgi:adenine-specific DNA-methyltransferase